VFANASPSNTVWLTSAGGQGRRARYRGIRNNLFNVRHTAAVQNLEILHRRLSANDNHQRIAA
jgi:hypothetical protein